MIIGEMKPIEEILEMVRNYQKILIVGCKGCVAVCNAGGPKEVSILGSLLRIARRKEGRDIVADEAVLDRQCEPKLIEQLTESTGRQLRCDCFNSLQHRPSIYCRGF